MAREAAQPAAQQELFASADGSDQRSDRASLVQQLASQLRHAERTLRHPGHKRRAADVVSTGIRALDELLPDDGFRRGTLVEWVSDELGSGALTLALLSAASMLRERGTMMVLDPRREFHPGVFAGAGINLQRTLFVHPGADAGRTQRVRPTQSNDMLWTLEQSLRSSAVALTLCRVDHLNNHVFRRLQLAAETGGGLCFLLRPDAARRQPTWADVRWFVQPSGVVDDRPFASRQLQVELLRSRVGLTGRSTEVKVDYETGDVRSIAELADPAHPSRAAGA